MRSMIRDEEFFLCKCYSSEHQFTFHYNEEENEIYVSIHLILHKNIFKRIWVAIKYIFGYTSKFGDWDEFILNYNDRDRLIGIIDKMIYPNKETLNITLSGEIRPLHIQKICGPDEG